jgi:protein-disulfide isomerase
MNVNASIGKISDINEIAQTGILMTPALIIDGKVKLLGKVPSREEAAKIIKASLAK